MKFMFMFILFMFIYIYLFIYIYFVATQVYFGLENAQHVLQILLQRGVVLITILY